jgi:pimeloyl-ACP methyl ester carboxylesterase
MDHANTASGSTHLATSTVSTGTLRVPGAYLYYEVRGAGPLIALVGAPMDATAFAPLADLLAADHTVLTTDPRGVHRSPVDYPDQDSTPELRADDLARLIGHLGAGPATVLGSSGGAVTALALVQAHPRQVSTLIAHEPPVTELLEDREQQHAHTEEVIATHLAGDLTGAWRKFLADANIHLPEPVFEQMFGPDRDPRLLADEHHWFAHEMRATVRFEPDIAALRAAAARTRIVVGIGEQSRGQICDRTSNALAAALGIKPTLFPGGHIGFTEDPARFEARLRELLDAPGAS